MAVSALTAPRILSGPLFWLPLLAATLFSLGALLLKRSAHWKVGVWRTTFVSNMLTSLAFIPLLAFGGHVPSWWLFWQPLLAAVLFVLGQVMTVLALTRGEVSVAAPVLGLKILMVPLFSRLLIARPLPGDIWAASLLATVGVMLLNVGGHGTDRKKVLLSLLCAGIAALSFALFDVLVQIWSVTWGMGRFLPTMLLCSAALSLSFLPRFEAGLSTLPKAVWPWLLGGAALIALQSLTFVCTVARWGQAAAANVVYSTRGLWSVLLVGLVGPAIGVRDTGLKGQVLGFRALGATLLLAAIALLAL